MYKLKIESIANIQPFMSFYRVQKYLLYGFYRTQVLSVSTLFSNKLTHLLSNVVEIDLMLPWHANSKRVDIVTDADVDNEERMCNSLVEILTPKIGRLFKILKLKFGQDIEAEVWSRFCGQKFGRDLEAEAWSRF